MDFRFTYDVGNNHLFIKVAISLSTGFFHFSVDRDPILKILRFFAFTYRSVCEIIQVLDP